jgi:iron complex transport system ATP-binding protein
MPLLSATNLSFSYSDKPILRDVSVSLESTQIVALIGPNGSGKSTLIRSLLGHLSATGEINWDNKPLSRWRRRELAKFVAYLPQTPTHDVDQTVLDVLRLGRAPYLHAFGLESDADLRVVHDVANELSLTDLLTRRMDELSGGQRQRVFVGRCLVQQPKALLLDEPNTYLDLRHQADLAKLLRTLSRDRGIGILMAMHDLNLAAAIADKLVLLDGGAVAANGTVGDVLQPALLSRVFQTPLHRVDSDRPFVVPDFS